MSGTSKIMEKTKNPMNIRFLNIFTKFRTQKEKNGKSKNINSLSTTPNNHRFFVQGGPLPVINGVVTPMNGLING